MLKLTVEEDGNTGMARARFNDPANDFLIWGLYEAPISHLAPWTIGRALTRMIELQERDDSPQYALAWMNVALTPIGRAATIIAAASVTTPNLTAEEAYEDVIKYWPEEDMSRLALEFVTKARLTR